MTTIERTKALRKELNLSQAKFAERFGLQEQTYTQWESLRRKPDRTSDLWLRTILTNQELAAYIVRNAKGPQNDN